MDTVMTASELIKQSESFGMVLRVVDGKIEVTGKPTSKATEFIKLLSMRKAEIIDELTPGKYDDLVLQDGPFVDDICNKKLPPLPIEQWVIGISDFDTGWRIRNEIKTKFQCAFSLDKDGSKFGVPGYYVVAPVEFTGVAEDSR